MSDQPAAPAEISPDLAPQDFVRQWAAQHGVSTSTETPAATEQTTTADAKTEDTQGGAAPGGAHNPTDTGSTPVPATTEEKSPAAAAAAEVDPLADQPGAKEDTDIAIRRARKLREDADRKLAEARRQVADSEKALAEQLRTNPRAALAKLGLDLGELIDADLAIEPDAAKPAAEKDDPRIKALEEKLAKFEMQTVEAKVQAAISKIHADVKADARFPLINRLGERGLELVTDRIVAYHQEHGHRITGEQAAKLVELDLREHARLLGVAQDAPKSSQPVKPAAAKETAQPQRQGSTTLTNTEVRENVTEDSEAVPEDPRQLVKFWASKVNF